jgi:ribonuclease HI
MSKIKIFTDGASRNNPGPAAAAAVFYDERGELLDGFSKRLGDLTNNQAEYEAVILALENVLKKYRGNEIEIYMDSQLACEQLKGNYKIKNEGLGKLLIKVKNLETKIGKIRYNYISREENKEADKLVNDTLDGKVSGTIANV